MKKTGHEFERGQEGMYGKVWREAKGRTRCNYIILSNIKEIWKRLQIRNYDRHKEKYINDEYKQLKGFSHYFKV